MLAGLQQPQPQALPMQPHPQQPRMGHGRDASTAADTSYSQNLNQIYANLNNYQSMIDNLESGGANNAATRAAAAANHNQFDNTLNQSKYLAQPMQQPQQPLQSNSIEILHQSSVGAANAPNPQSSLQPSGSALSFTQKQPVGGGVYDRERDVEFEQPQQQYREREASPPGGRSTSPYARNQMTSSELGLSQHRGGAGLG